MFATVTGALPRRTLGGVDLDVLEEAVVAGTADEASLTAATDELVTEWLSEQVAAGLEPLTDGEVRTADLGATVAGAIGLTAAEGAGPEWRAPILVDGWRTAASAVQVAVKQALPGPYTLARRFPGPRRSERALAIADALGREVAALAAAGCPLIEVQEPAAVQIGEDPAERELFAEAQRRLLRDAGGMHASLAVTGGDASGAGDATFFDTPYASFLFDLIDGPDHWRVIARAPGELGIVCGALAARDGTNDDAALLVWAAQYAASTGGRGLARVGLANASTLRALSRERVGRKLRTLGKAARVAAEPSFDAMAADLGPRALHSRSAVGGARPRPRPRIG